MLINNVICIITHFVNY